MTERTLLDVLDDLTVVKHNHVAQHIRDTAGERWVKRTATVPPLLELMHERVSPNSAADGGSKSGASTRSPADLEALYAYAKMCAQINAWCAAAGVQPVRDAVKDLRVWYSVTLSDNSRADEFYRRTLNGWVGTITAYLEPGKAFEAKTACPVCGALAWGDEIAGGASWPIEVRYRLDDDGRMRDETALCRACKVVWNSHESLMELAEEVAEKFRHAVSVPFADGGAIA